MGQNSRRNLSHDSPFKGMGDAPGGRTDLDRHPNHQAQLLGSPPSDDSVIVGTRTKMMTPTPPFAPGADPLDIMRCRAVSV